MMVGFGFLEGVLAIVLLLAVFAIARRWPTSWNEERRARLMIIWVAAYIALTITNLGVLAPAVTRGIVSGAFPYAVAARWGVYAFGAGMVTAVMSYRVWLNMRGRADDRH